MLKSIILKLLGRERIEFIHSKPFLVNGKYRCFINEIDSYLQIIKRNYGNDPELSMLLTRKFAHILDKGLHRQDVAPGHSKTIANELEKNLNIIEKMSFEGNNDQTILWAKEKLTIYSQLQEMGKIEELKETPKKTAIDFDTFFELLKERRSNRQFLEKTVDDEILEKLAQTVNWASSSCNKQPIKLFSTNNPQLAKECLKQCKGGTGFSEYVPCFVAFCADMRGYYLPDEMYVPAIDVSLGAQNFFLSTTILGLSCAGLSWALHDKNEEQKLRKMLYIPPHFQIIFNSIIGYASKEYTVPVRKSITYTLQNIK